MFSGFVYYEYEAGCKLYYTHRSVRYMYEFLREPSQVLCVDAQGAGVGYLLL